jgi:hypothetical protein
MSDRICELLNRNLQGVFGEGDAARRRAAIEELYTDDCVLDVPPGVFFGHDALDKFAHRARPGAWRVPDHVTVVACSNLGLTSLSGAFCRPSGEYR